MPFKSTAQQGFLFANKPDVAKEFAKHTSKQQYAKLPGHVAEAAHAANCVCESCSTRVESPVKTNQWGGVSSGVGQRNDGV